PQVRPLLGKQVKHAIVATYSDYIAAVTPMEVPEFVKAARASFGDPGAVSWSDALAADYRPLAETAGPDDLAALIYTSGTTGRSKGGMHSHRTLQTTAIGAAIWEGFTADSVALATAPFFHVFFFKDTATTEIYTGATI